MTTYVALLRGINVSGKNPIRMPALRDSVSRLGFRDVQAYLQSGNLVFRTDQSDVATLAAKIKTNITQDFGHEVPVLLLSAQDLVLIAHSNPLWPKSGGEETLFHCTFLFEPVSPAAFKALKLPAVEGERAVLVESAILLHCPHGYGRTKLNNSFFERALGVPATTRNWRTVLALQALCTVP
ncbi:DUF1697 domain-containing protein [Rhodoferax ferrireducens]|uniref:DUF1697 domain-containing protein n=1 Tax=Rhodoferax ferrireducens TaxID=192843 RepID=UPI000E0DAB01|nr:DUF1697 domain-containing protein [Rhodoferax ferrireducens]